MQQDKSISSHFNFRIIGAVFIILSMFFAVLGITTIVSNPQIINEKITAIIPHANDDNLFTEVVSREILILVKGEQENSNIEKAYDEVIANLQGFDFLKLRDGVNPDNIQKFIFANRYRYLPYFQTEDQLKEAIEEAVLSPFMGITDAEIQHDPFMVLRNLIPRFSADNFSTDDKGRLYRDKDGKRYYVIEGRLLRSLALSEKTSLKSTLESLSQKFASSATELFYTGSVFFSESATQESTSDMSRIGLFSVFALVVIFIWLFRGLKELLGTLFFLSLSLGNGIAAVVLFLGHLHVITLAMGMTLIGISVDYLLHAYMYKKYSSKEGNATSATQGRRKLSTSLLLSLLTSAFAYAIMLITDLVVLKELAFFAIVSLLSAFLFATLVIIPSSKHRGIKLNSVCAFKVLAFFRTLHKSIPLLVAFVAIISASFICYAYPPDDRVSSMQEKNPNLLKMDTEIRRIFDNADSLSWYLIQGKNTEDALQNCEQLYQNLPFELKKKLFLPCVYVPSKKSQEASLAFYKSMQPVLVSQYQELGIPISEEALKISKGETITSENTPFDLGPLFFDQALLIKVDANDATLNEKLSSFDFVKKLDSQKEWNQAFKKFREQLSLVTLFAIVLASVIIFYLMRLKVFRAFLIPVLSGMSAGIIANLLFMNAYFSMFSVLAIFMILGLGSDYCIIMFRSKKEEHLETMMSLFAAFLTTEASFGALAFSGTAVLASFGIIMAFGLAMTFVLVLALSRSEAGIS